VATWEALVPFLDDAGVSVAYDLSCDIVVILKTTTKFSVAAVLNRKSTELKKRWGTHRHSVRKASPVEVGARPANAVLDRFGDDAGYEH
jgi:hypothetical protein